MKKKIFYLILGVLFPISGMTITSCSTSWIHWNPNTSTKHTKYVFPKRKADNWKIRDKQTILKAWDAKTKILDLSKIQNHYELFEIFGWITKIKYSEPINKNWKTADWSHLTAFLNQINSPFNLTIKYGDKKDVIKINFGDDLKNIVNGIKNYIPYIRYGYNKKYPNYPPRPPYKGRYFDDAKEYDVEYHGLDSSGNPIDAGPIAFCGLKLLHIDSVIALLDINSTFAYSLSTMVNLPKSSFHYFSELLTKLDEIFNSIIKSTVFLNWVKEKKVNFNITEDGWIPEKTKPLSTLFKGKILNVILQ